MTEIHISEIAREERKRVDWKRVHLDADRWPALPWSSFRIGRYSGAGMRRERGGGK
jgi:hypothetical protein